METLKINGRPKKNYTINQGGLLITTFTNPKLPTEDHIPFENIKNDRLFYTHKSPMILVLAGISLMIFILMRAESFKNGTQYPPINNITWPTLSILFIALYFFLQPKAYFLKTFTGKYIKFRIRKNELEISQFIKHIIERRNEYIKSKYGTPSSRLPYDSQFSNFNIMARENIITLKECEEKIEELNKLFNQTAPVKTFPGYSDN